MQLTVKGSWRGSSDDYLQNIATMDDAREWFRAPNVTANRVVLETLSQPPTSLSKMKVEAWQANVSAGSIRVRIDFNPTRTLAHLLISQETDEGFAARISALDPMQFFSLGENVPLSLDGNDNWLADHDSARRVMGADIFGAFLPIFASKLQAFVMQQVAPLSGDQPIFDDGDGLVIPSAGCEVRIDWARARAGWIEAYFERFHSQARAVIRSAAQALLTGSDDVTVRRHWEASSFERSGDLFTIVSPLPNDCKLAVYAKSIDRIRFEVRRKARAYRTHSGPSAERLLTIMNAERQNLLTAHRWDALGDLLTDHDLPILSDLLELISLVVRTCEATGYETASVLNTLLTDGGIVATPENAVLIRALQSSGVLGRLSLRRRDRRMPRRYTLASDYRLAFDVLISAFSSEPA